MAIDFLIMLLLSAPAEASGLSSNHTPRIPGSQMNL